MNERIRAREVRVIDENSEQMGIMFARDALNLDGGGSTFGQDFIPVLRARGMPKVQRTFEWCSGPGFIGFSLLGRTQVWSRVAQ